MSITRNGVWSYNPKNKAIQTRYQALDRNGNSFGTAATNVAYILGGTDDDGVLMSAALEMLDQLEMIVAEADSYTAKTGRPVYNWLDGARAAIAKAKGLA